MVRHLLSIISVLLATAAFPQKGIQVGVKAVPTWAWFLNEDDEALAMSSWAFGFGANYHFNDATGVGLDVIWSRHVQAIKRDGVEWEHELSFFKLPLLLHFNSGSDDVVPFIGYVGLEYVSLREAHLFADGRNVDNAAFVDVNGVQIADMEPEDLFRGTNIGFVIGLGPGWNINDRFQFTTIARMDYMLKDPEDKDVAFFWGERRDTHLFTLGLDLGLKLIIASGGG